MKKRVISFYPIAHSTARILILGSMPGAASLSAGQYYAHPRNVFWKIMGELIGFDVQKPYAQRLNALRVAGIALWDVVHSCHRQGSLDTAIELDSLEVNDFGEFFEKCPHINLILFNGAAAERCYQKYVLPQPKAAFRYTRLPSTSPAHAALSFARKLAVWRQALEIDIQSSNFVVS
jgi:double-stranded uracil-DNA glycosylase